MIGHILPEVLQDILPHYYNYMIDVPYGSLKVTQKMSSDLWILVTTVLTYT